MDSWAGALPHLVDVEASTCIGGQDETVSSYPTSIPGRSAPWGNSLGILYVLAGVSLMVPFNGNSPLDYGSDQLVVIALLLAGLAIVSIMAYLVADDR